MVHKHLLHTRLYKTTIFHFIVSVIKIPPLTPLNNMYEDGALRILFELEREEVRSSWRKLHNKKLHNLCSSPNDTQFL